MKNELQLLAPSKRTTHLKQLLQKCGRVIPSEFPSWSFNHDYAIARQHQRSKNHLQNEIELLRIEKIQEKRTPVDTLLSNFCYSIEDVKRISKESGETSLFEFDCRRTAKFIEGRSLHLRETPSTSNCSNSTRKIEVH
ncbi:hypothetical protein M3Y94_00810100 [Aphelenchoides besseyi]|nr:hypothetical protein M3Y94_00810100 [Aphelenchoides besseyi]